MSIIGSSATSRQRMHPQMFLIPMDVSWQPWVSAALANVENQQRAFLGV